MSTLMPVSNASPDSLLDEKRYEEYVNTAEKVRTGEYFHEARLMYDFHIHHPMAERYFYIFITVLSVLIFSIAYFAMSALYPLNTAVPFIVSTYDPVNDLPRIRSITAFKGENPGNAVLRFLALNYITTREQYDINSFDRDVNSVRSQSSKEVLKDYQAFIDPRNADSPLSVYQRHSRRRISILSSRLVGGQDAMEIIFEAIVEGKNEIKKSHWRANISFQFSGVELDEKTDNVNPIKFVVTDYHTKRLQDVK